MLVANGSVSTNDLPVCMGFALESTDISGEDETMYSTQGWKTGVPLTENTEPTCTVSTKPTATNAQATKTTNSGAYPAEMPEMDGGATRQVADQYSTLEGCSATPRLWSGQLK